MSSVFLVSRHFTFQRYAMGSCLSARGVGSVPSEESEHKEDASKQHVICDARIRNLKRAYRQERDRNFFLECSNRDLIVLLGRSTFECGVGGPLCATGGVPLHPLTMKSTEDGYACVSLV